MLHLIRFMILSMKWLENILEKLGFFSTQSSSASGSGFYTAGSLQTKKSKKECAQAIQAVFTAKEISLGETTDTKFVGRAGDPAHFTMTRGGIGRVPLVVTAEIWELDDFRKIGLFVEETASVIGRVGVMAELAGVNDTCQDAVESMKNDLLQLLSQRLSEDTD